MNNSEKFGFEQSVAFFKNNANSQYVKPTKAEKDKDKMLKLFGDGTAARNSFISFANRIASNFTDLEYSDCSMWQGNKGRGRNAIKSYFWIQLKNPKWSDRIQSVSLSFGADNAMDVRVDIHQDNKGLKDSNFRCEVLKQQTHLIDLPLQEGLKFRTILGDDYAEYGQNEVELLRKKLNDDENLPLVQVGTSIGSLVERENSGTLLDDVVNAVRVIKTYYDHVMTIVDNSTISAREAEKMNSISKGNPKFNNHFSSMLYESKNLILRGAPGTGKSYLAKEIAADIITNGEFKDGRAIRYAELSEEQKQQVEFVQFHPNYDYSDFVEGLRPKKNNDGTISFELKDGIFKHFINCARKNYEDSLKSQKTIEKETSVQEAMVEFFSSIDVDNDTFKTIKGSEFIITDVDDNHINIVIPANETSNKLSLNTDDLRKMLESDQDFTKIKDVNAFFGKTFASQSFSYYFALYKVIKDKRGLPNKVVPKQTVMKNYVFIIDEINRGEISKIFGELFYSIDPGYRGSAGEITTQYSNMHTDQNKKFYIPENVYIIGTMNDIDRSVDSFDFAMRRRFRFVEIKPSERLEMLDSLKSDVKQEAIERMNRLNEEIVKEDELNENYQIGAAYFLKLNSLNFEQLWTDYLKPLLQEYVRGMRDELAIIERFKNAYDKAPAEGDADESDQN